MQRLKFMFLTVFIIFLSSCGKDEIHDENLTHQKSEVNVQEWSESEKLFFDIDKPIPKVISVRNEVSSIVININNLILQLNQQESFAEEFISAIGVPYWNATLVNQTDESYIAFTPIVREEKFIGLLVFRNNPMTDEVFMTYSLKSFNESYGGIPGINYYLHSVLNSAYHYFGFLNYASKSVEVRGEGCWWEWAGVNCEHPGCPVMCICEGQIMTLEYCQESPFINTDDDYVSDNNSDDDDDDDDSNGSGINTWIRIGSNTNGTTASNPNRKNRVRIIQDLSNEQLVIWYLLDWLEDNNIIMSEDGLNSEYAQIIQENPQIANGIYKYLEGYYTGVVVVEQYAIDLLTLFVEHDFTLSSDQIEHILTFEPDLIDDIDAFLDLHNDPIAYQIIRDFISLQNSPTTNADPSFGDIDYDNDFEKILSFYNSLTPNNINWLSKLKVFIEEFNIELPYFDLMTFIIEDCTSCNVTNFENMVGGIILENHFGVPITNVLLIDGYIFGKDANGILKIYLPSSPDPSELSSQELFDQVILVLNCVNLYYCETEVYEPIDWKDYFINVSGSSYVINWNANVTFETCPVTMLLDFTWGGSVMNTSYSHSSQTSDDPPINNWKWNGVNTDAALLQIATTSSNGCKDILYYFFNPNCN